MIGKNGGGPSPNRIKMINKALGNKTAKQIIADQLKLHDGFG